jgi:hypothetical protein
MAPIRAAKAPPALVVDPTPADVDAAGGGVGLGALAVGAGADMVAMRPWLENKGASCAGSIRQIPSNL